jgi:hypothetical protein
MSMAAKRAAKKTRAEKPKDRMQRRTRRVTARSARLRATPPSAPVLSLSWAGMPPTLHCPACGRGIFGEAGGDYCEHVLAVANDTTQAIEFNDDEFEKRFHAIVERVHKESGTDTELNDWVDSALSFEASVELLGQACADSESAFVMSIGTELGMGGSTCWAVIDFKPEDIEARGLALH